MPSWKSHRVNGNASGKTYLSIAANTGLMLRIAHFASYTASGLAVDYASQKAKCKRQRWPASQTDMPNVGGKLRERAASRSEIAAAPLPNRQNQETSALVSRTGCVTARLLHASKCHPALFQKACAAEQMFRLRPSRIEIAFR